MTYRRLLALLIPVALLCAVIPQSAASKPADTYSDRSDAELDSIWDLAAIKDPTTLNAEMVVGPVIVRHSGKRLKVFQALFNSFDEGQGPIRIHGFVALPADSPPESLAAVVFGHGAGGEGEEDVARALAAMLSAAVISFSGPGQGRSTGRPSTAQNWMRTIPIQQSWLYQYAYSAMRAVTYMATLPEVDPERIGMAGVSAGGVMTWIANGVDDRLAAACPIMATGDWPRSLAGGSWLLDFPLGQGGVSPDSPEAQAFEQLLDPIKYGHRQYAPVMLINGAQDEFFPIDTTRTTFEAVEAPEKRLEVIFDWDHGYFASSSQSYSSYNNLQRATTRIFGDLAAWFGWHLADGKSLPPQPRVEVIQKSGGVTFTIPRDFTSGASSAQLVYSTDSAYTFRRSQMTRRANGSFSVMLLGSFDPKKLVYFAEVQYPQSVFLTTLPEIPEGFVPKIRPVLK